MGHMLGGPHAKHDGNCSNDRDEFAYQLFCKRSLFGDFEIFSPQGRVATMRCEASGTLLSLTKTDFGLVCDEFPQFKETWRWEALRREAHRRRLFGKHQHAITYRHLAAKCIQEGFAKHLEFKKYRTHAHHGHNPFVEKAHLADMVMRSHQPSYVAEGDDDAPSVLMSKSQPSSLHNENTRTQTMLREFIDEMKARDVHHTKRYASLHTLISELTHLLHGHHGSETSRNGK